MGKSKPGYFREQRAKAIREGRCGHCRTIGSKAEPGKTMCRQCLDEMAAKQRERRRLRQEQNLCRDCGKPKEYGRDHLRFCKYCTKHHTSAVDKVRERRLANDECVNCGTPMVRYAVESQNMTPEGQRFTMCPACAKHKTNNCRKRRAAMQNRRPHG